MSGGKSIINHKIRGVKEIILSTEALPVYLPPYSPDLNPIEMLWSKSKIFLCKWKVRDVKLLRNAVKASVVLLGVDDECFLLTGNSGIGLFFEVDPSSLGFGMNVHDAMTLSAHFSGDVSRPIGTGFVKMKELHIPGLDFYKVSGNIFYEDSSLKFTDVTAEVYEGDLTAYGDYNLDTRYYNIYGHGKNLKTYAALPDSHLHCNVDLDITINSKGNARETSTSGSFSSSKGRYSVFKIDRISGKFKTEYNSINFYDVAVDVWNLKISTDALSIVDMKLKLNPIKITDENGNVLMTFTRD